MKKQQPTILTPNKKGVFNNMTKKRNSIAKLILCAVLTAMMMLSVALPIMADDPKPYSSGTSASDPAKAALTKIFMMPINTNTPPATFTFDIEPIGINEGSDISKMPVLGTPNAAPNTERIGSVSVSFTANQTSTFDYNGTRYLVAQTPDILAGLDPAKDGTPWNAGGAGIYKYHITENQTTSVITLNTDLDYTGEEFTYYSQAEYDIEIWVEEDEFGVLFPMYIVGYYVKGAPGEYYKEDDIDNGDKLDPTPGDEEFTKETPDEIGELRSQIIFTNRYWKTDGPTNPDPDVNALEVTKQVTGNNPNFDQYYTFNVKVFTPDAVGAPGTYKAYIVDKDGNYVSLSAPNPNAALKAGTSVAPAPAADYIEFNSGVAKNVELKHGERLVFFDLEVGAKVEANETIITGARVKYNHTFGPNGGIDFTMPVGTTGTWGFPVNTDDVGPHYTEEGAGANIATFYNNMSGNPPTGISIDNLPYIMILGIAIAGFIGFVVIKFRKNTKHDA